MKSINVVINSLILSHSILKKVLVPISLVYVANLLTAVVFDLLLVPSKKLSRVQRIFETKPLVLRRYLVLSKFNNQIYF